MSDNREDVVGVALTKTVCPICGNQQAGDIILNKTLTKHHADKVNEMHDKIIGYRICDDCIIKGVYIIEADKLFL